MIPYGKGKLIWSALPLENETVANYRRIVRNVLTFAGLSPTLKTSAPEAVEVITYEKENALQINLAHLNEDEEAVTVASVDVSLKCDREAKRVLLLPERKEMPFTQNGNELSFKTRELRIFDMYEIEF